MKNSQTKAFFKSKKPVDKFLSKEVLLPSAPIFASSSSQPNVFSLLTKNHKNGNQPDSHKLNLISSHHQKYSRSNSNCNLGFSRKPTIIKLNFKDFPNANMLTQKKNSLFFQMESSRKTKTPIQEKKSNEKKGFRNISLAGQFNKSSNIHQKRTQFLISQKKSVLMQLKHSLTSNKIKISDFIEPEKKNFSKSLKYLHNSKSFMNECNNGNGQSSEKKEVSYVNPKLIRAIECFKLKFINFCNYEKNREKEMR